MKQWPVVVSILAVGAAIQTGCGDDSTGGQGTTAAGTTSGTGGTTATGHPGGAGVGGAVGGGSVGGGGATAACQDRPPASQLPFDFQRGNVGTPVEQSDLEAITDRYLELLRDIRYFDFLEERVHGWPESDPQQAYWYGTWWSGVVVQKQGGQVTYRHVDVGGDNNGLRTGPLLEGALYAHLLWDDPAHEHLMRKMVRGFTSWIMAMEQNGVTTPTLLSRAAYPANIQSTDGGRSVLLDYSLNRPGVDNSATEYVNVPTNPYWGDIWIKNKRSKDYIGQMA
ncbi:MAG: hypothetical protein JRI68_35195, partial [Deltaproteobacteria bacterium]|nr:hypothetical protein [Deltaproteobacteria bacterium]